MADEPRPSDDSLPRGKPGQWHLTNAPPRPGRSPSHETLAAFTELRSMMTFQLEAMRELRATVSESNKAAAESSKATIRLFRMTVAALIVLAGAEKVLGYIGG